jgi:hypothetical protein
MGYELWVINYERGDIAQPITDNRYLIKKEIRAKISRMMGFFSVIYYSLVLLVVQAAFLIYLSSTIIPAISLLCIYVLNPACCI